MSKIHSSHWGSLKLRLAMAGAVLIGLSVGVTMLDTVHEVRVRTEQSILESKLDADKIAAALSDGVIERQRALLVAAQERPADLIASSKVLAALFDRVSIDSVVVPEKVSGTEAANAIPTRKVGSSGEVDILMSVAFTDGQARARQLGGSLRIGGRNFLGAAAQASPFGAKGIRTFVASQDGVLIAAPDPRCLLKIVDGDPLLRPAVKRWREQGSPLEPAPWADRMGDHFYAMAAVPGTDWMVFRVADVDDLFGKASQSILHTIALGCGVALAGAVLIFGITAGFMKPMDRLQRRALRALERDQPASEGWPEAHGEVGDLSRILRHVSERAVADRSEIERTLRRIEAVLALAPAGIAFTNEATFELVNRQLEHMLGYRAGELTHETWDKLLANASTHPLRAQAVEAFREGRILETELPLLRRDGTILWTLVHGSAVTSEDGIKHAIWIVADITQRRRQREELHWTATHDPLTNLVNRREFDRQLEQVVSDRRRGEPASALFIDLDHFKQVNDQAGHAAGDVLLQRIAEVLADHVRSEDTVGRLGGDEFAVILRACHLHRALQVAEKIRAAVEIKGVWDAERSLQVTASIGVVEIGIHHPSLAAVLAAADQACYAAKNSGRNAVCSLSPSAARAGATLQVAI